VDRKFKKKDSKDQQADFIRCVAMGKSGEFAEKYFHKGLKVAVCGRIQTGSYTNKDGNKVYTTDVVVEEQEFCESKNANQQNNYSNRPTAPEGNFMDIPDGIENSLPFA
jgi:single-strand DNA-binding protein